MNENEPSSLSRAAATLRSSFDEAFTRSHDSERPPELDLLLIGVAEHGYALALSQIAALHEGRRLVPVPSPRSDLLGLVGVRGAVAPAYDLAQLLGYAPAAQPRWLAQLRTPAPFALAFEHFERHLRVPVSDVLVGQAGSALAHRFAPDSVKTSAGPIPLLDLLAIFAEVTHVTPRHGAQDRREERP